LGALAAFHAEDGGWPILIKKELQRPECVRGIRIDFLIPSGARVPGLQNLQDLGADFRDGFASFAHGAQLRFYAFVILGASCGYGTSERAETDRRGTEWKHLAGISNGQDAVSKWGPFTFIARTRRNLLPRLDS
jgi:hypothetical protein